MIELLVGLLTALLPEEARRPWVLRYGVDPPFWSGLLGVVQGLGGGLLLVHDFMTRMPLVVDELATQVVSSLDSGKLKGDDPTMVAVGLSGSYAWLIWVLSPLPLFLIMSVVVGVVRVTSFALTREAVGEPLVWLGWRLWRSLAVAPARAAAQQAHFGPQRPDRVLAQDDDGLLVLTARPRPEWNELVTIQVGERFYRLEYVEERADGRWHCWAHQLREEAESAVVRGLVVYHPPAPRPAQALPLPGEARSAATKTD